MQKKRTWASYPTILTTLLVNSTHFSPKLCVYLPCFMFTVTCESHWFQIYCQTAYHFHFFLLSHYHSLVLENKTLYDWMIAGIKHPNITLPSKPRHIRFFPAFRVTFSMQRVCFKSITWYTEMHHVRTFFSVWRRNFFSYYVMFIQNMFIFKRKAYRAFCV